jgi:hypothetical protein
MVSTEVVQSNKFECDSRVGAHIDGMVWHNTGSRKPAFPIIVQCSFIVEGAI